MGRCGRQWAEWDTLASATRCVVDQLKGKYECRLDDRGRLRLPASLIARHQEDGNGSFVLREGLDHCLTLYPMSAWDAESRRVMQLDDMVDKERRFKRMFFLSANDVSVDSNGRIVLPRKLAESVGIDRDVVILGVGRHYEIWDQETHEADVSAAGDLKELARDIYGKRNERA